MKEFFVQLARDSLPARHRRLVVATGRADWALGTAHDLMAAVPASRLLWVGGTPPPGVAWSIACGAHAAVLGQESDAIVYNAFDGLDVDTLGAVSGTLHGGGIMLLLCPPLDAWPQFADPDRRRYNVLPYTAADVGGRFLQRLVRVIAGDAEVLVLAEGAAPPRIRPVDAASATPPAAAMIESGCRTGDQCAAVEAILHVARGHSRRPVVLTSDRGRGKSSALGIAAATLLREGYGDIVVTGPGLNAVARVFDRIAAWLPGAQAGRASYRVGAARIDFMPPDLLAREEKKARLLLVDEAAAIPAPLLEQLLRKFSRIVFATTVHGYEGTGRGFDVRFRDVLERETPKWRALRMETPIRWGVGDPLERFVFRALMLDAAPAAAEAITDAAIDDVVIGQVDRDRIAGDDTVLGELFGLLVLAHYRTRPYDLRCLLDCPNVSVHAAYYRGHVVGALLLAEEGRFDPVLAAAIAAGARRPHGHMIPESLAAHSGLEDAPLSYGARILRIAVHPAVRRRGIGARLVRYAGEHARNMGCDYLGSGFGMTAGLLDFWRTAGLMPVRVSASRGAASGTHSCIVISGLSATGEDLYRRARDRYMAQLPWQFGDSLRELDAALATRLLARGPHEPATYTLEALSLEDWRDLVACAHGRRVEEVVPGSLWRFTLALLQSGWAATPEASVGLAWLVQKSLQQRPWAGLDGAAGQAGASAALRRVLRQYLDAVSIPQVRDELARLRAVYESTGATGLH